MSTLLTSVDSLDDLIIDNVLFYLDLKSLLLFSSCQKRIMSCTTHRHVLWSATTEASAHPTTRGVMKLALEEKSIFFPSPTRLLRLLCAKRCEKCLLMPQSGLQSGLFLCDRCRRVLLDGDSPLNDCPVVFKTKPLQDGLGEAIGPLLIIGDTKPRDVLSENASRALTEYYKSEIMPLIAPPTPSISEHSGISIDEWMTIVSLSFSVMEESSFSLDTFRSIIAQDWSTEEQDERSISSQNTLLTGGPSQDEQEESSR